MFKYLHYYIGTYLFVYFCIAKTFPVYLKQHLNFNLFVCFKFSRLHNLWPDNDLNLKSLFNSSCLSLLISFTPHYRCNNICVSLLRAKALSSYLFLSPLQSLKIRQWYRTINVNIRYSKFFLYFCHRLKLFHTQKISD